MADYTLEAIPVVGGFDSDFNGTRLRELVDMAAVAVSVPMGGDAALGKKMQKPFGGGIPAVGESYVGPGGRVMAFSSDQFMVLFDHVPHSAVPVITKNLGETGYYVEQTNNWVFLELSGPLARPAMERICAVNTAKNAFPINRAERTSMDHMGAVLCRTGEDSFLIMSASSTAGSFLHGLETSLKYVS